MQAAARRRRVVAAAVVVVRAALDSWALRILVAGGRATHHAPLFAAWCQATFFSIVSPLSARGLKTSLLFGCADAGLMKRV